MAVDDEPFFNRKHNIVTVGVMKARCTSTYDNSQSQSRFKAAMIV